MRFLFGFVLGLALGFAGAILFAPQASPLRQQEGEEETEDRMAAAMRRFGGNSHDAEGLRGAFRSIRKRVNEALDEAKKAADEAEREIQKRFDEAVGREPERK